MMSTREGRWGASLWGVLIVLCTVVFLDGLDVSMVGVALPSIQAELGMSTSALQWVVSGYVLGYGGLLLLGGRTADLLGRRRVLLVALGVFAFASLLGGIVDSGALLIAARFVKGMSAAFTAPRRAVHHHHDLRRRARAQPGPQHLHRLRGQRLLPRADPVGAADRTRLAVDLPDARAGRHRGAGRGGPAAAAARRSAAKAATTSSGR